MSNRSLYKFFTLIAYLLSASFIVSGQAYKQITNLSGTQVIGGQNITVTGINSPGGNYFCNAGPYYIGFSSNATVTTTGYHFSFSTPVEKIRFQVTATDIYEIFTLSINNNLYSVIAGQLSPFSGNTPSNTCNCPYTLALSGGRITVPTTVGPNANVGFQLDISGLNIPGGISSVELLDSVASAGSVFSLFYLIDTTFNIRKPFTDTLKCLGDSLKISYDVTHKFSASNVFKAQLSDGNGNFTYAMDIGSLTSDTSGTISCYLPDNIPTDQHYRIRLISSAPADTTIDNGKNIRISQFPDSITAASNTPVCVTDSIKLIASSTTSGISYSWTGPAGFNSPLKNPIISNASSSAGGNYIVSYNNYSCIVKDTITVVMKPAPAKPVAGSNSPVCPATDLHLTGSTLANGITRNWSGPGGFNSTLQSPSRNNIGYNDSGRYVVTDTLNGCISRDTEIVAVMITTPTPTANSNNPVCIGGTINFTVNTIPGASYKWTGPGNFNSNVQNAQRTNATATDAGTYYVKANINGCISLPDSVTVTTIQGPTVSVYASPKDTICAGINGALVSIPFGIGTQGATYEWFKNGSTTGVTTPNYIVPNVNNGDKFYVQMLATGSVCNSPIQSNTVTMTVLPASPSPAATITANPGTDVWPGLNVNFSISNLANGGNNPGFQWMRNNNNIGGATANKWSTTDLKDGDSICLMVTSSNQCATPKVALSNCLAMKVPASVNTFKGNLEVELYPNPNNGSFIVRSQENGILYIYNLQGQDVGKFRLNKDKTIVKLHLPPGIYIGRVVSENSNILLRVVIQ